MKYFYGINKKDPNNTKADGKQFVTKTAPDSFVAERDRIIDTISDKIGLKSLAVSKTKSFIFTFSLIIAIVGIIVIIRAFAGSEDAFVSSKELIGKHVWLPIVTLLSVGYAFFFLIKLVKSVKNVNYDSAYQELERLNALGEELMAEMGVPSDSASVDVFSADYKDGKRIKNSDGCDFSNLALRLYREGDALCIFDGESIFEFKISEMIGISTVCEKTVLFKWNKDTPVESEEWLEFGIKEEKNACISIPTYHILEVSRNGECFGIYFGNYDLKQIEELTGITA